MNLLFPFIASVVNFLGGDNTIISHAIKICCPSVIRLCHSVLVHKFWHRRQETIWLAQSSEARPSLCTDNHRWEHAIFDENVEIIRTRNKAGANTCFQVCFLDTISIYYIWMLQEKQLFCVYMKTINRRIYFTSWQFLTSAIQYLWMKVCMVISCNLTAVKEETNIYYLFEKKNKADIKISFKSYVLYKSLMTFWNFIARETEELHLGSHLLENCKASIYVCLLFTTKM